MLAALILAVAISALATPADPQFAVPAPRDAAPRDPTQEVKVSGVIRGRITSWTPASRSGARRFASRPTT